MSNNFKSVYALEFSELKPHEHFTLGLEDVANLNVS